VFEVKAGVDPDSHDERPTNEVTGWRKAHTHPQLVRLLARVTAAVIDLDHRRR
jgi:hypothetical protein